MPGWDHHSPPHTQGYPNIRVTSSLQAGHSAAPRALQHHRPHSCTGSCCTPAVWGEQSPQGPSLVPPLLPWHCSPAPQCTAPGAHCPVLCPAKWGDWHPNSLQGRESWLCLHPVPCLAVSAQAVRAHSPHPRVDGQTLLITPGAGIGPQARTGMLLYQLCLSRACCEWQRGNLE